MFSQNRTQSFNLTQSKIQNYNLKTQQNSFMNTQMSENSSQLTCDKIRIKAFLSYGGFS
jgi:hypothetical protein